MILEGIVTTQSPSGLLNIAPMGPKIAPDMNMGTFVLRPFKTSTTYQNLKAHGEGVFHVTDDVLLLAQAAIGVPFDPEPATRPADSVEGRILVGACRYYEFQTIVLDDLDERTTVLVETVAEGRQRDFLGFNRARHAVVEAAILATRIALIPPAEILSEFQKLAVLVDKTGGPVEHRAFDLLREHVRRAAESTPPPPPPDRKASPT
ncbi:MAG: DUF447 family protein [Paludisphaera borealis]|uniref:DUF447 domain-containing protein n=1 Tax=Paludisphaera borealis TaxID=1387353 RepID=UPI0028496D04|nr:DUF447 domain-containing protein [Paludisphaera borealis]MDR3621000.1 DUF447 family protein [Paludisphaera borealis]